MSFATELAKRLTDMNAATRDAVSDAFTTFQTAVSAEMTTYSSPPAEAAMFDQAVLAIAADVADQMRGELTGIADSLLSEAGDRLLTEASAILTQE